jgi:hypothetical protein
MLNRLRSIFKGGVSQEGLRALAEFENFEMERHVIPPFQANVMQLQEGHFAKNGRARYTIADDLFL